MVTGLVFGSYLLVQALIVAYSSHRYLTLWRRRGSAAAPPSSRPGAWPHVTVQLPLWNEPRVVDRLIDAAAALDYPRDRLEIQVLDDSSDSTTAKALAAAGRHRRDGIDVTVIHRDDRTGYKAGALAAGLARARGELVAVFDADFVPPPDFLRRLVPHFTDARVGMVQARWTHLNRDRSLLTAAQAVMLDAHFLLEQEARMRHGLFFNFNGTAGIWRRAAIEGAGGWSSETLTEDLDLSYRAQLAGWKFVFDSTVECPAELPVDMAALRSQQRRWTRGSLQTARLVLPRLLASPLRAAVKVEAIFHLTCNLTYPLMLALSGLVLPVMLAVPARHSWLGPALQAGIVGLGVVPVGLFLFAGQRAARVPAGAAVRGVLSALVLGIGLTFNNSRAALAGLWGPRGEWERTPKTGDVMQAPLVVRRAAGAVVAGRTETALAVYFAALAVFAGGSGHERALPFILLLLLGFGYVAWVSQLAVAET